jgi:hypothetical protein
MLRLKCDYARKLKIGHHGAELLETTRKCTVPVSSLLCVCAPGNEEVHIIYGDCNNVNVQKKC